MSGNRDRDDEGLVIKLRGLPWSATEEEIIKFLGDCLVKNGRFGVYITQNHEGRPSGEAYLEMETPDDVQKALQKNKHHIGRRYIEVFKATRTEMEYVLRKSGYNQQKTMGGRRVSQSNLSDPEDMYTDNLIIKMRGLPWEVTVDDILKFLGDCRVRDGRVGVHITMTPEGRPSGEAFVEMETDEDVRQALLKDKQRIGHRYIEVFKTKLPRMNYEVHRSGPSIPSLFDDEHMSPREFYGGGGGGHEIEGFVIKMRGLPWSATVEEIVKFFDDCKIKNGRFGVHLTMTEEGRPSGEAYVEMASEDDVREALKKDRDHMGHRYIEVLRAKQAEMEWVVRKNSANLQNAMDDGCVRLRGLIFGCSKEEILHFFTGLEIAPNGISLPTDSQGRSTGEAYVQFVNKDVAEMALKKHKDKMGHRYIEIFRSSLAEVRSAMGPKMRLMGGFGQRPGPYDREDRFGGANRYGGGPRGSRSFKGFGDYDDNSGGYDNYFGGPPGEGFGNRESMEFGGFDGLRMEMGRGGGIDGRDGGPWNSSGRDSGNWSGGGDSGIWSSGGGRGVPMRELAFRGSLDGGSRSGAGGNDGNWGGGPGRDVLPRDLPFRSSQADFPNPLDPVSDRLLYERRAAEEERLRYGRRAPLEADEDRLRYDRRAPVEADLERASREETLRAMAKFSQPLSPELPRSLLERRAPEEGMERPSREETLRAMAKFSQPLNPESSRLRYESRGHEDADLERSSREETLRAMTKALSPEASRLLYDDDRRAPAEGGVDRSSREAAVKAFEEVMFLKKMMLQNYLRRLST